MVHRLNTTVLLARRRPAKLRPRAAITKTMILVMDVAAGSFAIVSIAQLLTVKELRTAISLIFLSTTAVRARAELSNAAHLNQYGCVQRSHVPR